MPADELLNELRKRKVGDIQWDKGKAFCLVYHPGEEIAQTVREAYNLFFYENALNPAAFPSLRNMESEVVSMCADLFRGSGKECGNITSGGTESILLAVKTARDWAKQHKPEIKKPEIIVPETVHPAFHKAFHYFGIEGITVGLDENFRADIQQVKKAINSNTIMLVGSAPSYPHGVIDPISELANLALEHKVLMHVDACVGGFFLPFLRKLGYPVYDFDFFVEGVTSISADLHKYGFAAKGASVIIYKDNALRKHQFFVHTTWPGGIYGSPTLSGTRPGGSIAAAWTALHCIGEQGYMDLCKETMETVRQLKDGFAAIPEISLIGKPDMSLLAIGSETIDIYAVGDELSNKGWMFDRQQNPASLHFTVSTIHRQSVKEFLEDLNLAVEKVNRFSLRAMSDNLKIKAVRTLSSVLPAGLISRIQAMSAGNKSLPGRLAPLYGMMGALSGSGDLETIVLNLLDRLNSLE